MLAFGKLKAKSAWKLYAGAKNIPFEIADLVSTQIEEYETALKYAEEEGNEDEISIYDYVDSQYHTYINESKEYRGIIVDKKPHPCGYLIFQDNISEALGLIRVKSKTGDKSTLCAVMDGKIAEKFGYLKNDLLKVDVVNLIKETYKRIGIPEHTVRELNEICSDNKKVWDIYSNGYTMGINQIEKEKTTKKAKAYKMKSIAEATAFVAAIRPSFKQMYKQFEAREKFEFGIKSFDKIIQGNEFDSSWLLYQEQLMQVLGYAGIPQTETYAIIKDIAKKREDEVKKWKNIFIEGFSEVIIKYDNVTPDKAKEYADKIWSIIENYSKYGFNASHAYSVANDSLYGAYLKAYYPLEFYETLLRVLDTGKHFDRIGLVIEEMKIAFGINIKLPKFGEDNRQFTLDKNKNLIYYSLKGVKNLSEKATEDLYALRKNKYKNFYDLLLDIKDKTCVNSTKLETLIKINYFEEFGNSKFLIECVQYFEKFKQGNAKQLDAEGIKTLNIPLEIIERHSRLSDSGKTYMDLNTKIILNEIHDYLQSTITDDYANIEKIQFQQEYLGYINIATNKAEDRRKLVILDFKPLYGIKSNKLWGYNTNIAIKIITL
jgi:DNA polymerase III alpha subunit